MANNTLQDEDSLRNERRTEDVMMYEEPLNDTPNAEVWMADGNIIVAAVDESKKQRHLFKCHRGFLCKRLPALEDMFAAGDVAVSASASEQYEGLPVVRFYDPYEQVKLLLECLYDARCVLLALRLRGPFLNISPLSSN